MQIEKKYRPYSIAIFTLSALSQLAYQLPNRDYLHTLNGNRYFFVATLVFVAGASIVAYLVKGRTLTKLHLIAAIAVIAHASVGWLYAASLPAYTYEEAVRAVEAHERQSGREVQVIMPEYRESKLAIRNDDWLVPTNYSYYVYLIVDGTTVAYRFNPRDGEFQTTTRQLEPFEPASQQPTSRPPFSENEGRAA